MLLSNRMGKEKKQWIITVVVALFMAIPIYRYYRIVWGNAYNAPFEDDFDSALSFIASFAFGPTGFTEKLKQLFALHNEHRIVFDRLVFLTDYYLFGKINFRHLILVGNLSLLLLGALLYRVSYRDETSGHKLFYLLPVAYSLFLLHYWELTVWGMASLQNLWVLVFAALSLFSLSRNEGRSFVIACVAAVMAVFTSGNGMFTFVVGIPVLLLLKQRGRLLVWAGLGAAVLTIYFLGYQKPGHHPDVYDSLVNNTSRAFTYFLTLTGSLFSARPEHAAWAGWLFLGLYLGILLYLWYQEKLIQHLPIISLLSFLYLTCLALMATRSGFGVQQAFSSRYGILSVTLFGSLSILATEVVHQSKLKPFVSLAFLATALYLYFSTNGQNLLKIADRTRLLQFSSAFYNDNPKNLILYWGDPARARAIFVDSQQKGTYQVPPVTFEQLKSSPQPFDATQLNATNDVISGVQPYATHDYIVFFNAWAVINGVASYKVTTQVIVRSEKTCYSFDVGRQIRYDVANQMQSLQYLSAGFSGVINKKDLQPGRYTLWLYLTNGQTRSFQPLNVVIDV